MSLLPRRRRKRVGIAPQRLALILRYATVLDHDWLLVTEWV